MSDALEIASAKLLGRLRKERRRPVSSGGTEAIGGIGKLGSTLEALRRELLVELSDAQGVDVNSFLPNNGAGRIRLGKATLGQLASAVSDAASSCRARQSRHRALLRDLQQPSSVIFRVIGVRNAAVHDATLAKDTASVLAGLDALVERHRREAGWQS